MSLRTFIFPLLLPLCLVFDVTLLASAGRYRSKFNPSVTLIKEILNPQANIEQGREFLVQGSIRSMRAQKKRLFMMLNDGSLGRSMQITVENSTPGFEKANQFGQTGASFKVKGKYQIHTREDGTEQRELLATEVTLLGTIDEEYPFAKTGEGQSHGVEHLRKFQHLRARTGIISAAARLRDGMEEATNRFFRENGFFKVHTPIITAADCEGAGEMFQVVSERDTKDQRFFGKLASLTVSGQLHGETYAQPMGRIFTFGPTFRAEPSNTSRHLSEFWMIEPEFNTSGDDQLQENMDLAEDYIKYCVNYALENWILREDLEFLAQHREIPGNTNLVQSLKELVATDFKRITYTQAFEILSSEEVIAQAGFDVKPTTWGMDFGSEHETYLTEHVFKRPVIVTNYPRDIKSFYMKQNEPDALGRRTVQGMDVLVPGIGEVIGGSVRETDYDKLVARMAELDMKIENFKEYLDLRRQGTIPHAGFGLGFERLIRLVTGIKNIRDVIPFPRAPGECAF